MSVVLYTLGVLFLSRNGGATDRYGTKIQLFRDVREILSELDGAGIKIAAASRLVYIYIYHDTFLNLQ